MAEEDSEEKKVLGLAPIKEKRRDSSYSSMRQERDVRTPCSEKKEALYTGWLQKKKRKKRKGRAILSFIYQRG